MLPVPLRPGHLLGLGLVMVRPEALALTGRHHADFVSPGVASAGTMERDPLGSGMCRNAAVFCGVAPPPLAPGDGVGQEVAGHALTRAHQLPDGLGAATGAVCDVASGAQLSAAQLRGAI